MLQKKILRPILAKQENGTTISERTTFIGNASDEDGNVTKVEVSINGEAWITVNGITSWNYVWDITEIFAGNYTIRIRAYDGEDYSDEIVWKLKVMKEPGAVSEESSNEDGFIPGFEFIAVIAILGVSAMLVNRKRTS